MPVRIGSSLEYSRSAGSQCSLIKDHDIYTMASPDLSASFENHQQHVLRTLAYYDIFRYPLKTNEVHAFLGCNDIDEAYTQQTLDHLTAHNKVFQLGEYYALANDTSLVAKREAGNARAQKRMKLARRISRFIGNFPFVRGVGLSGSLSKNYMDEKSDIDFFIITAPGRLWVTRMMLIGFKKLFLFNSYKFFCVNYLITEDNLEIEDKNVFTATELVTLIPTYGQEAMTHFYEANRWARKLLPNSPQRPLAKVSIARKRGLKWFAEVLLSGRLGDWLDRRFLHITLQVWKRKFGYLPSEEFDLAFRTREDVSKHHPSNFQRQVLQALEERLQSLEEPQRTPVQTN